MDDSSILESRHTLLLSELTRAETSAEGFRKRHAVCEELLERLARENAEMRMKLGRYSTLEDEGKVNDEHSDFSTGKSNDRRSNFATSRLVAPISGHADTELHSVGPHRGMIVETSTRPSESSDESNETDFSSTSARPIAKRSRKGHMILPILPTAKTSRGPIGKVDVFSPARQRGPATTPILGNTMQKVDVMKQLRPTVPDEPKRKRGRPPCSGSVKPPSGSAGFRVTNAPGPAAKASQRSSNDNPSLARKKPLSGLIRHPRTSDGAETVSEDENDGDSGSSFARKRDDGRNASTQSRSHAVASTLGDKAWEEQSVVRRNGGMAVETPVRFPDSSNESDDTNDSITTAEPVTTRSRKGHMILPLAAKTSRDPIGKTDNTDTAKRSVSSTTPIQSKAVQKVDVKEQSQPTHPDEPKRKRGRPPGSGSVNRLSGSGTSHGNNATASAATSSGQKLSNVTQSLGRKKPLSGLIRHPRTSSQGRSAPGVNRTESERKHEARLVNGSKVSASTRGVSESDERDSDVVRDTDNRRRVTKKARKEREILPIPLRAKPTDKSAGDMVFSSSAKRHVPNVSSSVFLADEPARKHGGEERWQSTHLVGPERKKMRREDGGLLNPRPTVSRANHVNVSKSDVTPYMSSKTHATSKRQKPTPSTTTAPRNPADPAAELKGEQFYMYLLATSRIRAYDSERFYCMCHPAPGQEQSAKVSSKKKSKKGCSHFLDGRAFSRARWTAHLLYCGDLREEEVCG